ncbi:arginase family protein [Leifsonia shinshuensis]|uniref:arginase family protein n=1 Tax=Leifsonia shinshuensis TaxID=150026 RepID=UPI00285DB78E|nr:arginase family protein [Leifsonia shinshuensis]MDR6970553.1 arginase [Leifsonia shinshuensis]
MITLVSAPSNLGLRPPQPGGVPGAAKAPEALREAGLYDRLSSAGARDGGVVLPGRYVDDDATRAPGRVRNQDPLVDHTWRLAERIGRVWGDGRTPLVVGGDCSVLLGAGVATARRGRAGLIHIDGHTDFRHPGNSDACGSVAGEDLAAAVGLHWSGLSDLGGLSPYVEPRRAAHIGHRADDEYAAEARERLGCVLPAAALSEVGVEAVSEQLRRAAGPDYWVQVDVDVLDPSIMPAVDSPDDGGITASQLTDLLRALAPDAIGASVTVFDPDLDPHGDYARLLVDILVPGLSSLGGGRR